MLTIRLQRIGKTKHALYRLIISEKARDTQGTYLENFGTFNPHDKEKGWQVKTDRIQYWLSKGAQASNTVHNLLVKHGILKGAKKRSVYFTKKRQAKLAEKKKAAAAPAPAAEAPAPAPEAPAAT